MQLNKPIKIFSAKQISNHGPCPHKNSQEVRQGHH